MWESQERPEMTPDERHKDYDLQFVILIRNCMSTCRY